MGIIEDTITPLSQAELNILHLESNVWNERHLLNQSRRHCLKGIGQTLYSSGNTGQGHQIHMTPINSQIT